MNQQRQVAKLAKDHGTIATLRCKGENNAMFCIDIPLIFKHFNPFQLLRLILLNYMLRTPTFQNSGTKLYLDPDYLPRQAKELFIKLESAEPRDRPYLFWGMITHADKNLDFLNTGEKIAGEKTPCFMARHPIANIA